MTIKCNKFAILPHTCSECKREFIFEPYKCVTEGKFILFEYVRYTRDVCKKCVEKESKNDKE